MALKMQISQARAEQSEQEWPERRTRTRGAAAVDEVEAVHEVRHQVDGVFVLHGDHHVLHPRIVRNLDGRHLRRAVDAFQSRFLLGRRQLTESTATRLRAEQLPSGVEEFRARLGKKAGGGWSGQEAQSTSGNDRPARHE